MLRYEDGETVAHGLDPRSKLAVQFGFAIAAFGAETALELAVVTTLAAVVLAGARLSPFRVLWSFRFVLVLIALAPLFAMVVPGPPWLDPAQAGESIVAGYRVILILLVSGAYVTTTPVRETRAAIQRHVPGKPGQLLGVGVGLVFRFFPVVRADLRSVRAAISARGGDRLGTVERVRLIAFVGLSRAFSRAERLSVALRARCFAWNPTLPQLQLTRADYPVFLVGLLLALYPLARWLLGG